MADEKKKSTKNMPPSLFDNLDLFAADYGNPSCSLAMNGVAQKKAERAVLRAEKAKQKHAKAAEKAQKLYTPAAAN